jgi:hypothetical protein
MRSLRRLLFSAILPILACGDDTSDASGGGGQSTGDTTATGAGGSGGVASGGGEGGTATTAGADAGGERGDGGGDGGSGGATAEGYGQINGTCGVIDDDDLLSDQPQVIENVIDFSARPPFDVSLLSASGQEMYADGNLGGSSLFSEIFAFEILERCDQALLLKTEGEIVYQTEGKKTDILVEVDGLKLAISVVRAVSFPEGDPYPVSQAYDVIEGKLADILESSVNVAPEDAWEKQMLSVLAQTPDHAAAVIEAYAMIDAATKADTIVHITVTEGDDDFIYYGE